MRTAVGFAALLFLLAPLLSGCGDDDPRARDAVIPRASPDSGAARDPVASIRRVLEADEAYSSRYIRRRYPNAASWVEGHRTYAREMGAISLEETPTRFAEAFRRHQEAWAAFAAWLETIPPGRADMFLDRSLVALPENRAMARKAATLNQEIATTWVEVEMRASTRGIGDGPSLRSPPAPVGSTRKLMGRRK